MQPDTILEDEEKITKLCDEYFPLMAYSVGPKVLWPAIETEEHQSIKALRNYPAAPDLTVKTASRYEVHAFAVWLRARGLSYTSEHDSQTSYLQAKKWF